MCLTLEDKQYIRICYFTSICKKSKSCGDLGFCHQSSQESCNSKKQLSFWQTLPWNPCCPICKLCLFAYQCQKGQLSDSLAVACQSTSFLHILQLETANYIWSRKHYACGMDLKNSQSGQLELSCTIPDLEEIPHRICWSVWEQYISWNWFQFIMKLHKAFSNIQVIKPQATQLTAEELIEQYWCIQLSPLNTTWGSIFWSQKHC